MRGKIIGQNQEENDKGKGIFSLAFFSVCVLGFPVLMELFEKWTRHLYRKK